MPEIVNPEEIILPNSTDRKNIYPSINDESGEIVLPKSSYPTTENDETDDYKINDETGEIVLPKSSYYKNIEIKYDISHYKEKDDDKIDKIKDDSDDDTIPLLEDDITSIWLLEHNKNKNLINNIMFPNVPQTDIDDDSIKDDETKRLIKKPNML